MEEIKYYEYSIVTKPLKNYRFKMAASPTLTQLEEEKNIIKQDVPLKEAEKPEFINDTAEVPLDIGTPDDSVEENQTEESIDDGCAEIEEIPAEVATPSADDISDNKPDDSKCNIEEEDAADAVCNPSEKTGLFKKNKEKKKSNKVKKEKKLKEESEEKEEKKPSLVHRKKKENKTADASDKRNVAKEKFQKSEKVKKPRFSLFEDIEIEETLEEKVAKLINNDGYYDVILPEDEGHQVTRRGNEDKTKLYLILGLGSVCLIALSYIVIEIVNML